MDSISHRKSSWDAPGPLVRPGGRLTGCTAASMASAVRSGWVVAGSGAANSSALLPAQPMLFVFDSFSGRLKIYLSCNRVDISRLLQDWSYFK